MAVFTTYSFQKYGLITYHLVKASASEERAQIPIVGVDPAFCSWIFTPSSSVLCRKKKNVLGNSLFLCVRYYCLIPPPFEMKFRVVLSAWNASRPEEALFPQLLYWGNLQRLSPCYLWHEPVSVQWLSPCYLWHGGQGAITSNNFASCIWDSLVTVAKKQHHSTENDHFILRWLVLPKQKRMSFKLPPLVFCTNGHHSNAQTSRNGSYLDGGWQCPCGYREEAAWQTNILACGVHTSHYFCEATPKTVYCQDRWPYILSWFF